MRDADQRPQELVESDPRRQEDRQHHARHEQDGDQRHAADEFDQGDREERTTGMVDRRPSASRMPIGSEATMPTMATTSVTRRPPQSGVSTGTRPKSVRSARQDHDERHDGRPKRDKRAATGAASAREDRDEPGDECDQRHRQVDGNDAADLDEPRQSMTTTGPILTRTIGGSTTSKTRSAGFRISTATKITTARSPATGATTPARTGEARRSVAADRRRSDAADAAIRIAIECRARSRNARRSGGSSPRPGRRRAAKRCSRA